MCSFYPDFLCVCVCVAGKALLALTDSEQIEACPAGSEPHRSTCSTAPPHPLLAHALSNVAGQPGADHSGPGLAGCVAPASWLQVLDLMHS